uniref:Importin N-terminal domain-containing protein n=1 Tax=Ciona savignyi TaxID=51511 RepID=H2ZR07_CIOSA
MRFPNTSETISEQFFRQWINDVDCFLGIHDRRMCVLGLCTLMDLPHRPPCIEELSNRFIPSLIVLFQGLVRAYKVQGEEAASDSSDSSSEDEEEDFETAELASDEDEIDEESTEYLEMLQKKEKGSDTSSVYSDEETDLESFNSVLEGSDCEVEEFTVFKLAMKALLARDPQWYNVLMTGLSDEQRKSLEEIYVLADQRHAAAESKKIEKTGGYRFENASVPSSFSFATTRPPTLSP